MQSLSEGAHRKKESRSRTVCMALTFKRTQAQQFEIAICIELMGMGRRGARARHHQPKRRRRRNGEVDAQG